MIKTDEYYMVVMGRLVNIRGALRHASIRLEPGSIVASALEEVKQTIAEFEIQGPPSSRTVAYPVDGPRPGLHPKYRA